MSDDMIRLLLGNLQHSVDAVAAQVKTMSDTLTKLVGDVERAQSDITEEKKIREGHETRIRLLEADKLKRESTLDGAAMVAKPMLKGAWLAGGALVGFAIKYLHSMFFHTP